MNIGYKISNLMNNQNITQENLADYLGVSQTKIHYIISGKTQKIDFQFMLKVCHIFDVDIDYFVDEQPIRIKKYKSNFAVRNPNIIRIEDAEVILENMLQRIEFIEKRLDLKKGNQDFFSL